MTADVPFKKGSQNVFLAQLRGSPVVVKYRASKQGPHLVTFVVINHELGLLGFSETSFDLRDMLARKADEVRAAEAVAEFYYKVKK